MRRQAGALVRLLHCEGSPVVVRAWQRRRGEVVLRAGGGTADQREQAIARMRFAIGVDDDLTAFNAAFKRDPFLGPAIRARPWLRPRRRPLAWEAFAWAITAQLIESARAAEIQRQIVRRWGARLDGWQGRGALRDVPTPESIAILAPAELESAGLSAGRSLAMIRCAREIAAGRIDPADRGADALLRRVPGIGAWTTQCLGLFGRGEPDSLPAGDLGYVKLVAVAAGLERRASVEEVEDFYARYGPYRGLAGIFTLAHYYRQAKSAVRGLPMAPDAYADAA